MRTTFLVLLACFLFFAAGTTKGQQQPLIDSLSSQLRYVSDSERIDLFNHLSEIYWQRSFDSSLLFARHAFNLASKIKDERRTAQSLKMTGNAYYLLGDYKEGLDSYISSLKLFETIGDSLEIGRLYNNMGAIHLRATNYDQALDYFETALKIEKQHNDSDMIAAILNNIGAIHHEQKDYAEAFDYFLASYEIRKKLGNERQISISLNNLGEVSNYINKYSEALDYYNQSLLISTHLNDKNMMATVLVNIGDIYFKMGRFKEAEKYLGESLELALEVNNIQVKQEIYRRMSQIKEAQSNYKESLKYYKLLGEVRDTILSEDKQARIAEIQLKFNAEAFQHEINLRKKENELNQLLLNRQRIIIFSLILILLLSLFAIYINYKNNLLKKESNRLLTEKNLKLEEANKRLQESEQHLKELNATKDKFFSIIGHDLRNPLNALLGFSELISAHSEDYNLEEIQSYNKIINESAKNIHHLVENLLEWSRSQSGNIEFNPEELNLKQLISEIVQIHNIYAGKKDISIRMDAPEEIIAFADRNLLATIIRNLLANAIKFTPAGGKINISTCRESNSVRISVTDNGIGMSQEQVSQLFQLEHSALITGTSPEKGTGLGLILCKEFIDMHHGDILVESEPGKGTSFIFTLPDKKS